MTSNCQPSALARARTASLPFRLVGRMLPGVEAGYPAAANVFVKRYAAFNVTPRRT